MEIGIELLDTVIKLPLGAVIAIALAGIIVGMLLLIVATALFRPSLGRNAIKVNKKEETNINSVVATELKIRPRVELKPVVTSTKHYKPVPPVRQHYWYYVAGVSGRFATLREALSASGVNVPSDKMLDWKKLTSDTRARIKRVKVDAEQPVLEQPLSRQPVAESPSIPVVVVAKAKGEPESVIKKPIGNGCFVTVKKKTK